MVAVGGFLYYWNLQNINSGKERKFVKKILDFCVLSVHIIKCYEIVYYDVDLYNIGFVRVISM